MVNHITTLKIWNYINLNTKEDFILVSNIGLVKISGISTVHVEQKDGYSTCEWEKQQILWKTWLKSRCAWGVGTREINYTFLLVDDKYKVLYCYIPKAGCTAWKNILALAHSGLSQLKFTKGMHKPSTISQRGLDLMKKKSSAEKKCYPPFLQEISFCSRSSRTYCVSI